MNFNHDPGSAAAAAAAAVEGPGGSRGFTERPPRGPGESLLHRGLATYPLGLGT